MGKTDVNRKGTRSMLGVIGAIGDLATVLSAVFSVLAYVHIVRNDRKQKSNRPSQRL